MVKNQVPEVQSELQWLLVLFIGAVDVTTPTHVGWWDFLSNQAKFGTIAGATH